MAQKKSILQRSTVGRKAGNTKVLGDALTTLVVGGSTGLFAASRQGSSGYLWSAAFIGLGAITMLESQPGTLLESGGAGLVGGNGVVFIGKLLGMVK